MSCQSLIVHILAGVFNAVLGGVHMYQSSVPTVRRHRHGHYYSKGCRVQSTSQMATLCYCSDWFCAGLLLRHASH